MKLSIFIPSLEIGGTEGRMLLLADSLQMRGHQVSLWCLRATGPLCSTARERGIRVVDLQKKGRYDLVRPAIRLRKHSREETPDVIISCLPSANLYALINRLLGSRQALVWGLAADKVPIGEYGRWAKMSYSIQAKTVRWVDKVVVNSVAGCKSAQAVGYPVSNLVVIHNGIDTAKFRFSVEYGRKWRQQMGIPQDMKLVGMVGRLDPTKNYEVFLQACAWAAAKNGQMGFVIVGGGETVYAREMKQKIDQHPLYGQCLFHKESERDMVAVYSALDVMTLTSKSEGLPNVIVEALACERPCVVTDVGDCRLAVGQFGKVCRVGDWEGIAVAWLQVIEQWNEQSWAKGLREHVEKQFGLGHMAGCYEQVAGQVIKERHSVG